MDKAKGNNNKGRPNNKVPRMKEQNGITIENVDGEMKMVKRNGHQKISNFTMVCNMHALNEEDTYIFECQLKTSGVKFKVPITLPDLDTNEKACSKIVKCKDNVGGWLDLDQIRKNARINHFMLNMIENYEKSSLKKGVLVLRNQGFISCSTQDNEKIHVYCLGPDEVLPVSQNSEVCIHSIEKVWLGDSDATNFVMPKQIGNDANGFIKALHNYHGCNHSSPLAVIAYAWLSLHRSAIYEKGMKLGIIHAIGEMCTGKSTLAKQIQHILPKIKTSEGLFTKEDETMSIYKLKSFMCQSRHLVIQDPPYCSFHKMNEFLDLYYENRTSQSRTTKNIMFGQTTPSCGGLFVWPNEEAFLLGASNSALTKGIFLYFKKNNFTAEDFRNFDINLQEKKSSAPHIFLSLIQKPNLNYLEEESHKIMQTYIETLTPKINHINNRLLQQYSLIHAASKQFIENIGLSPDILNDMQNYFLDTCIPFVLKKLEKNVLEEKIRDTKEPEVLFINKLKELNEKNFMCHVGWYWKGESMIGFSCQLIDSNSVFKSFIQNIFQVKKKQRVLSEGSGELWFKRAVNGDIYGKSRKILMYIFPVTKLDKYPKIKELISSKLSKIMGSSSIELSSNIKKKLDDLFDNIYLTNSFVNHSQISRNKISFKELMKKYSEYKINAQSLRGRSVQWEKERRLFMAKQRRELVRVNKELKELKSKK